MFKPRPGQDEVLSYQSGRMGIAAVPGSGKTHTLSCLAAQLVADPRMQEGQEVLIVTLVNSAVQNFSARIATFIAEKGLLPNLGYRVRTLHGLAHDIVRERPDLVGLSDRFTILEEREAETIIHTIVNNLLPSKPELLEFYKNEQASPESFDIRKKWPETVESICSNIIRVAKDFQASPQSVKEQLTGTNFEDPLLAFAMDVYMEYQRALSFRSAVDFDDLISLAVKALTLDPDYLARLHWKWPFILEDEAQDSSRLQEIILNLLCGENGNWVRVGDPNQAIFETFTTASPEYLRKFLASADVKRCDLNHSGRSSPSIIWLANELVRWGRSLQEEKLRNALSLPYIFPVPAGDPQPNPPDNPAGIFLRAKDLSPEEELNFVVKSLENWLPSHPDQTCAVLVPRNDRGAELAEKLKSKNVPFLEMLRSSSSTRKIALALSTILQTLADPNHVGKLADSYEKVDEATSTEEEIKPRSGQEITQFIRNFRKCEELFTISEEKAATAADALEEGDRQKLSLFLDRVRRWQNATLLPIDQLLLIIGQGLFTSANDLALVHKLALSLERSAIHETAWQLPDFALELTRIASNQRKFLGFDEEDTGFEPDKHRGKALISTIHKAKGLEWDRVYILSANNYDFPFGQAYDNYIGEKWFIRDHLNLEAEMLAKFTALVKNDLAGLYQPEGIATQNSRVEYSAERLRLFFVAITRARKELCITWNTGRRGEAKQSMPFEAIRSAWEAKHAPAT